MQEQETPSEQKQRSPCPGGSGLNAEPGQDLRDLRDLRGPGGWEGGGRNRFARRARSEDASKQQRATKVFRFPAWFSRWPLVRVEEKGGLVEEDEQDDEAEEQTETVGGQDAVVGGGSLGDWSLGFGL